MKDKDIKFQAQRNEMAYRNSAGSRTKEVGLLVGADWAREYTLKEVEGLVSALEFYKTNENWNRGFSGITEIERDAGNKAREALKNFREKVGGDE